MRGPLPTMGLEEDLSFVTLLRITRYFSVDSGVFIKSFRGVTEHHLPFNKDAPLSVSADLHQLITKYRVPVNKLLIAVPLYSYVHVLNSTDHYFLGDASTLLSEREDLAGSGFLTYDRVKTTSDLN
jgi:hypothetical protein